MDGDDGSPVEEVGSWAKQKHDALCRYVDITKSARAKFLGRGKAGATYIDLFCGPGRAKIRRGEYIDGSCVAAWKQSKKSGAPFSSVLIADTDPVRRNLAAARLRALDAPVKELTGNALEAARIVAASVNPGALHFAFIDPFNLANCEFEVLQFLSKLQRMDMLVHISIMDMRRNLGLNISQQSSAFDRFAPGWRDAVDLKQPPKAIRVAFFEYWKSAVAKLLIRASTDIHLINGDQGQQLYWLTLVARHDLAHRFWKAVLPTDQGKLF